MPSVKACQFVSLPACSPTPSAASTAATESRTTAIVNERRRGMGPNVLNRASRGRWEPQVSRWYRGGYECPTEVSPGVEKDRLADCGQRFGASREGRGGERRGGGRKHVAVERVGVRELDRP